MDPSIVITLRKNMRKDNQSRFFIAFIAEKFNGVHGYESAELNAIDIGFDLRCLAKIFCGILARLTHDAGLPRGALENS